MIVQLTLPHNGQPVFVNVDNITIFGRSEYHGEYVTRIEFGKDSYIKVKEDVEAVARAIKRAKETAE